MSMSLDDSKIKENRDYQIISNWINRFFKIFINNLDNDEEFLLKE